MLGLGIESVALALTPLASVTSLVVVESGFPLKCQDKKKDFFRLLGTCNAIKIKTILVLCTGYITYRILERRKIILMAKQDTVMPT